MKLDGYNIATAFGNTVRLKISLEREEGFTENDKVLLKIRKRDGEQLLSKILDISDGAVFFMLDSVESKSITFGEHRWDITVYINAQVADGEIIAADEVITPFINAKYNVARQASREVD